MARVRFIRQGIGIVILAVGLMWVPGCNRTVEPTAPVTGLYGPPLYDRLGARDGIEAVVDQLVAKVARDNRIKDRFANADIQKLKRQLVEQICHLTDGPCTYRGRDMKTLHAGMKITSAEFNAFLDDLIAALDANRVPRQEKQEVISLMRAMKKDIVEVP